ncbi:MAG TPA: EAL domain-containing protein [Allosphingosinicella sp.]|nr:EAL domain-containing protein [Allosphingosinicella sp.]
MLQIPNSTFLASILDAVPQIVWTSAPDRACTFLNKAWYEFTGGPPGGDIGAGWAAAVHPEDWDRIVASWFRSAASGEPFRDEYRLRSASGEYRWMLAEAAAEVAGGAVIGWCGTCTDIHDRVGAEEKLLQAEAGLRKTIDHIPQMIWSTLPDGHHDYYSPSWYKFTGAEEGTTDGDGWNDMFHEDDRERAWALWRHSLETGAPYEIRYRLKSAGGGYRWVLARALPERDAAGEIVRWYGTCTDIHAQVLSEEARRDSEALHRSILEASVDCIKIVSTDGHLQLMNAPGVRALELAGFEAVRARNWAALWPEASRATVAHAVAEGAAGRTSRFTGFCPTAKGSPRWWDVLVSPMFDEDGKVVRLLSISRDITAQREASEQFRWASEHDALTSLPNRRSFQAHLQAATIRAMESGEALGLLLIDLDHFKHVNDTLGHAAGDQLLKTFGQRLKSSVRGSDLVARLGGDEFAVILHGVTSHADLLTAGESILKRLGAPISFEGRALSAGASIGGAMFPEDGQSAHELFKNADTALYALKGSGRGGTRMFHSHMRAEAQKVASQLSLARIFVNEKSVVPHFQQKVDLASGRVRGFEALLRLRHPARGILPPDTVAEAFKDYELASKIGELMQESVFAEMQGWRRGGLDFGTVSINAAPAEFLRDDFAERFLGRVERHGLPPELLEVEVTEHVFLDRGTEYVSRALRQLNQAGVRISLDDFGTGYSSLSHLRDFPVDVVKIDRSFVSKMLDEPEIGAIVTAVIDLAGSLAIDVIAEGVETEAQKLFLCGKGCTLGQGFLFGRAVEGMEVPHLVRR